jgi:hypothetical protein
MYVLKSSREQPMWYDTPDWELGRGLRTSNFINTRISDSPMQDLELLWLFFNDPINGKQTWDLDVWTWSRFIVLKLVNK